jgi:hypothetical protein
MSSYLYELDPIAWQCAILRIDSDRASDKMKILSILLPDLLYRAGNERVGKKEGDIKGTFTDFNDVLHVRMAMRDVHIATGWHRNSIGRVFKALNNSGVVSYRTFREKWEGHSYNLSYVAPLDNLWMAHIYMPDGQERNNQRGQRHYKPTCVKCEGTLHKLTGGIEYECLSCGNRHVYYPLEGDIE